MKLHLLFAVVIAFLLVTCKGQDYSRELSEIDSLKSVLNSTDSMLMALNPEEISRRAQDITDNSKFIQYNVTRLGDTLDYSTALLLSAYGQAGDNYRRVNEEIERLDNAIDSMNLALDNLKHDMENHSMAEGLDGKASVIHEKVQVNVIAAYTGVLKSSLNNTRRSYDSLLPRVNTFVQQISARVSMVQVP